MEVAKLADALLVYGPLGIICILALMSAIFKDRQLTAERSEFLKKQDTVNAQHNVEMQALEERYITKAETWMAKYHDLATSQDSTIKALKGLVDQLKD